MALLGDLTYGTAPDEWVASLSWGTAADGVMADHLAGSPESAAARARVNAFLVDTRPVQGALYT